MTMIMLDRDGVLNEDRADYVKTLGELVLVPGAAAAVARLNRAGVTTVVVTNQAITVLVELAEVEKEAELEEQEMLTELLEQMLLAAAVVVAKELLELLLVLVV